MLDCFCKNLIKLCSQEILKVKKKMCKEKLTEDQFYLTCNQVTYILKFVDAVCQNNGVTMADIIQFNLL
jgi:hypothetical protein